MKMILFSIFALGISLSFTMKNSGPPSENGALYGVVNYKDAYEPANQPDEGSEIYALSEAEASSTQYRDIDNVVADFQRYKSNYSMTVVKMVDPSKIKTVQDNFDLISTYTGKYINGFKHLPGVVRTTASASGNYTVGLKPGRYYVLIVSGNVKSSNTAESGGNIGYKTMIVKPVGETMMNVTFEKHENPGLAGFTYFSVGC